MDSVKLRDHYRKNARQHREMIEKLYAHQIQYSSKNTLIYDYDIFSQQKDIYIKKADQIVWPIATDQAVIKAMQINEGQKIAALNFASYVNPGGGFLYGARAQEEMICAQSDLYPVIASQREFYIWNMQHQNCHIYLDRALYSPDIIWTNNEINSKSDVITCAAPNKTAGRCSIKDPGELVRFCSQADKAMINRMDFVKRIAEDQQVDVLILGAWGAGAFGFKPLEVAKMWQRTFDQATPISKVIYAVIPDRHGRSNAVEDFEEVFQ